MEQFISLVGEFGLAVTLVLAFVAMFYKVFCWQREDSKEREARDRDTITRFSEIISTNSKALLQNSETMEKINGNIENISHDVHKLQDDVTEIKLRQQSRDDH